MIDNREQLELDFSQALNSQQSSFYSDYMKELLTKELQGLLDLSLMEGNNISSIDDIVTLSDNSVVFKDQTKRRITITSVTKRNNNDNEIYVNNYSCNIPRSSHELAVLKNTISRHPADLTNTKYNELTFNTILPSHTLMTDLDPELIWFVIFRSIKLGEPLTLKKSHSWKNIGFSQGEFVYGDISNPYSNDTREFVPHDNAPISTEDKEEIARFIQNGIDSSNMLSSTDTPELVDE
ncbi:MAG: hypothetical protein E7356_00760 [Clostridiales bacterium]|nr:hypothetical protein [Clostridiales bacterium]